MVVAFWLSLFLLLIPYVVYPIVVWILGRLRPRWTASASITPSVSVIISAHNEQVAIERKLRNTTQLDYVEGGVEIILADDASTDATVERAVGTKTANLKIVRAREWRGKTAAQNAAVREATGEILLFTDATAMLEPIALRKMVSHFADPNVGCVTANIGFETSKGTTIQKGLQARRDYEVSLRINQSIVWTILGATGAAYAIPRALYVELPESYVSDFMEPVELALRGYRTIYEPNAWVYMDRPVRSDSEFARRRRIVVRSVQGMWHARKLFNPFRFPWMGFTLFWHRLVRLMGPFFLVSLLVSAAWLAGSTFYAVALALQVAVWIAAGVGLVAARLRLRIPLVHLPYFFALANVAALAGWWALARGKRFLTWGKT